MPHEIEKPRQKSAFPSFSKWSTPGLSPISVGHRDTLWGAEREEMRTVEEENHPRISSTLLELSQFQVRLFPPLVRTARRGIWRWPPPSLSLLQFFYAKGNLHHVRQRRRRRRGEVAPAEEEEERERGICGAGPPPSLFATLLSAAAAISSSTKGTSSSPIF